MRRPELSLVVKREFVCVFSRAGFHFVGFGDTHLNEIALLFNGDVNYSAVKTSHDTHEKELYSNLERAA